MITWNQRNKSNIKLIGTWILQTIRPCQKDYHCETMSVYGAKIATWKCNLSTRFEVLQWIMCWTMCPILLTGSLHPSLIRHGQLSVVWCDKMSVRHAKWLFNSNWLPITNNVSPFNSLYQFKILWSISLLLLCVCVRVCTLYIVHQQKPIHSVSTICAQYYTSKKVIEFHEEQSIKWNRF